MNQSKTRCIDTSHDITEVVSFSIQIKTAEWQQQEYKFENNQAKSNMPEHESSLD